MHYLFFLVFIGMHLFFLNSDPNILLDDSRGAFTDEGLYLCQINNAFKGFGFNAFDTDGFLKTPIYNLIMAPFVFFNSLWLLRFIALLFVASCFSIFLKIFKVKGPVPVLISLCLMLQSNLFGHSHLVMAECFVFGFILLSLSALFHSNKKMNSLAFFFLFMAVGCKIQYVYLGVFAVPFFFRIRVLQFNYKRMFIILIPVIVLVSMVLFYFQEYKEILSFAKKGKFQEFGYWLFRVKVNLIHLWGNAMNVFLTILSLLSIGSLVLIWKKVKPQNKWILGVIIGLILFEGHKLLFIYLPQRYLYVFFGLLVLFNLYVLNLLIDLWKTKNSTRWVGAVPFLIIAALSYTHIWNERSYQMQEARKSLSLKVSKETVLVGPWAASLSFGLENPSYTAWSGFFENREHWQLNSQHALISELDYKDNQDLFKSILEQGHYQKIDSFQIGDWELGVFKP